MAGDSSRLSEQADGLGYRRMLKLKDGEDCCAELRSRSILSGYGPWRGRCRYAWSLQPKRGGPGCGATCFLQHSVTMPWSTAPCAWHASQMRRARRQRCHWSMSTRSNKYVNIISFFHPMRSPRRDDHTWMSLMKCSKLDCCAID